MKNFDDQRGGGEYIASPSKIFCLTVPEDFLGGGGEVYQDFPWKIFCITAESLQRGII